jgi:6-phosphogluconolactonase (cycloisomerase 2 family)
VSIYRVDEENGALILLGTAAAGESPRSLTIDPTDRFVYVSNLNSNNVSAYEIESSGELKPIGTFEAGERPRSVTVARTIQLAPVSEGG